MSLKVIVSDPLSLLAALWARSAEICISSIFFAFASISSLLFEELVSRADDMSEEYNVAFPEEFVMKLEKWRRNFDLVCQFVEKINSCFGPVFLLQTALVFSIPIFDCNKILLTKQQVPRFYFEFAHSIFRFFLMIILPSYLVSQQVKLKNIETYQKLLHKLT